MLFSKFTAFGNGHHSGKVNLMLTQLLMVVKEVLFGAFVPSELWHVLSEQVEVFVRHNCIDPFWQHEVVAIKVEPQQQLGCLIIVPASINFA